MAAKLNGSIDFLQLESYSEGQQIDWGFTSYRRSKFIRYYLNILLFALLLFFLAHVRTGSAGSPMDINNIMQSEEDLRCMKISSHKAHQQAITVLDSEGGRVLTGSQDHTLKVYRHVSLFHDFSKTSASYAYIISNSISGWRTSCHCIPFMVIAAPYPAYSLTG